MSKIQVGIVELNKLTAHLLRLLIRHPKMTVTAISSQKYCGNVLGELLPFLRNNEIGKITISSPNAKMLAKKCKLIFSGSQEEKNCQFITELLDCGIKVIDLGTNFRLRDKDAYGRHYGWQHSFPDLLSESAYGLPEIFTDRIQNAWLTTCPGEYAAPAILALYPGIKKSYFITDDIILDGKSNFWGTTEKSSTLAGKDLTSQQEEIENILKTLPVLEEMQQEPFHITFLPHFLPLQNRLICSVYCKLAEGVSIANVLGEYLGFYTDCPWIQIFEGEKPLSETKHNALSCNITIFEDLHTKRIILQSTTDYFLRSAGQAIAVANIINNIDSQYGII